MISTIPFNCSRLTSEIRAELINNQVNFVLPAQYHGNPVSSAGSLVFHDFGWDLIDMFYEAGFAKAVCEVYAETSFGHFGDGQIVFRVKK